ncbi:putative quinol monooxygenase [Bacillus swezeyi]|uniref:Antibiotic biosynthesis monooxygenase n=1 Tax=Bacillus swezeyi TaxID=1925020 RepID=A0A1R1QJT4_9BACI|nr:putative quinol monooxygenase [Bacillus swezeyi]MEC1260665.1 putative quinol monooxygenase [Bacillus swezeyi]MED2928384.1 putative quinol monooxygenase [Bacillus swezeyi]MED2942589.1 putative quinol monooxygenase [Bacillus swezeyi]MED2964011.1 putative quinol monooxygenase [Bacillus swezeyi]MED3074116.1 putative quinol monooxygenase [Bacillus swezeyi]
MIVLQAYMKVKPEKRESFLESVHPLLKHSRAEAGNAQYQLFEDVENANTFVMLEQWKDEEALNAHNQTEHFQTFVQAAGDLLAEPLNVVRTQDDLNKKG